MLPEYHPYYEYNVLGYRRIAKTSKMLQHLLSSHLVKAVKSDQIKCLLSTGTEIQIEGKELPVYMIIEKLRCLESQS